MANEYSVFTILPHVPITVNGGGQWSVDASEAGLRPGIWPRTIAHGADIYFRRDIVRNIDGEVQHVVYTERSGSGATLTVFND